MNSFKEASYIIDYENVDFSGKEVNLQRYVELAKYNDWETEAKAIDWQVRTKSEDEEFNIINRNVIKAFYDRFILMASDYGLSRYEKLLGIKGVGTLEERRKKVFILWNKRIAYTDRSMRAMLDLLVGKNKYEMILKYNEYGFYLNVFVDTELDLDFLAFEVRKIIPANLSPVLEISLAYKLDLISKSGDYSFPYFRCGEHKCATIPYELYTGDFNGVVLNMVTGEDRARDYKLYSGQVKAGEKINSDYADMIFRQMSPLERKWEDTEPTYFGGLYD